MRGCGQRRVTETGQWSEPRIWVWMAASVTVGWVTGAEEELL